MFTTISSIYKKGLKKLSWLIGTGAGIGLSPIAPGTCGSAAALLIYIILPIQSDSALVLILIILLGLIVGIGATGTLSTPDIPDPSKAVWDEFIGLWITCLFLPKSWEWLIPAFLIFRFFDILKPWPSKRLESLPKGWGIMLDDVLAGIYGCTCLNIVQHSILILLI